VLGPWTHGRRSESYAGDVDFGPRAPLEGNLAIDYAAMRADFFDTHLGAAPATEPPVRYFLMGGGSGRRNGAGRLDHGGSWQHCHSWPPEDTVDVPLYLHSDGSLETAARLGSEHVAYQHDPSDPVPTIGGQVTSGEPVMAGGAFDQRPDARTFTLAHSRLPLAERRDVLTFQTAELSTETVLAGGVVAHLVVSSSAVDTDVTIKLIDVHPPTEDYPEGFAMNLTDGILRCRYRESFERPVLMQPGRDYAITVTAPDCANRFLPGHRIRLDISSSNFPRFDINSGTGEPEATTLHRTIVENRIHLNGRSWVQLRLRRPT